MDDRKRNLVDQTPLFVVIFHMKKKKICVEADWVYTCLYRIYKSLTVDVVTIHVSSIHFLIQNSQGIHNVGNCM